MRKLPIAEADLVALARMMGRIDFFSPLTVGQVEQILPFVGLYGFDRGQTVFKQGEVGDAFYLVHSGSVEVRVKQGWLSFAKKVAVLGEGAFFGEMALISSEPRSATIVCAAPTKLFALTAADFKFVLVENPATALQMRRTAAQRRFESSH
jgi:trk system potassium uptake protein